MVDQLLGGIFGGQDDKDDNGRKARAKDFVNRFETGAPHEGYSDEEAIQNYRSVAGRLSPQQYEEAAAETFERMAPEERKALRRMMKERSRGRLDVESEDPRDLARSASRFRQEESGGGGLASLFGGGNGDRSGDGGGMGDLMNNPIAKVALGGIAAMAMKKVLGR